MPVLVWALVVVAILLAVSWFTSMVWVIVKICFFIFLAAIAYEVIKRLINNGGGGGRGGPPLSPA